MPLIHRAHLQLPQGIGRTFDGPGFHPVCCRSLAIPAIEAV